MRVLFLTNFYPPHELGGQERSCREVVEGLKKRGHQTLVVTSMFGTNNVPQQKDDVYRQLYLEMDIRSLWNSYNFFFKRKAREKANLQRFRSLLAQFDPDIIFVWGMWNLPRSLAAWAETEYPKKVVYRFADYWPTLRNQHIYFWQTAGRHGFNKIFKFLLRHLALPMLAQEESYPVLKFDHAICVSSATRDELVKSGIPISHARVIHSGIDVAIFINGKQPNEISEGDENTKLLYAGRLSSEKGVDIAIKAMVRLVNDIGLKNLTLRLAGSGPAEYTAHLKSMASKTGLENKVFFLGQIPPEEMPELLKDNDILIVPSIWKEPFSRIVLEGMAAEMAVVATPTGGTSEVVINGENGLLFEPGNSADLAEKINALVKDKFLCHKLARAGQKTVVEKFTYDRMMDEIESHLHQVAFSQ